MRDPHPGDLQKACQAFIKSLHEPAAAHSVYGQTRVNRATGDVEQVIVIHRHPNHPSMLAKQIPAKFGGFPVIEMDWPAQDL